MALKQSQLFNFEENNDTPQQQPRTLPSPVLKDVKASADACEINKKSSRGRKKLSETHHSFELTDIPEDEILFQKKYYSIGLVAEMFKVNVSLIRFWEKEFDILMPKKNGKGDRHFRPEDIKNLKMIHHLLREKKYTIEGAREFLKQNNKADENFSVIEQLKKTQLFLNELKLSL